MATLTRGPPAAASTHVPQNPLTFWHRILVADDLTPASEEALRTAVKLAGLAGAELLVLNVLELWLPEHPWRSPPTAEEVAVHRRFLAREEEATRRALEERVAAAVSDVGKRAPLPLQVMVHDGRASDTIVTV